MTRHRDRFAAKLSEGKTAFGSFVFSRDPANTEILGHAGFDLVVIDTEHAALEAADVADHVRAANAVGLCPWARVGRYDAAQVGRLLDAGVQGIIFPHFGMGQPEAAEAISALRYAPEGSRPTCTGMRGSGYGLTDFAQYARDANRDIWGIGLVEDGSVVDRLPEAFAGARINAVMPGGIGDLASSLGLHGQGSHPRVVEAARTVVRSARAHGGLSVGVYVSDPAGLKAWQDEQIDFFIMSIDFKILASAYRSLMQELESLTQGS
jgi:2-keto-3-deoxy-L-rhamnonate aldolase RhmA